MHLFRGDCHTKKPFPILAHMAAKVLKLNLTLNLSNPGAGTDLAKIEPFVDMLKDGYSEVACIETYMVATSMSMRSKKGPMCPLCTTIWWCLKRIR